MLWIALHLPRLSLEAFEAARAGAAGPAALLDGAVVACANDAAQALGVRSGQSRATALALAPGLLAGQADAARNREALAAVVQVALVFSPTVTVSPWSALAAAGRAQPVAGVDTGQGTAQEAATEAPRRGGMGRARPAASATRPRGSAPALPAHAGQHDGELTTPTVLLEVQTTLAFWGGRGEAPERQRQRLLAQLLEQLAPLGHALQVAIAPTAAGAAVLAPLARPWRPGQPAEAARALNLASREALARGLDAAPVGCTAPGRQHAQALQGMGLRQLRELRALPRSGLARRFGEALLDTLDRAYGDRPDPRPLARLAERFDSAVELAQRAESVEALLQGAEVLLQRLCSWLRAHQARTRRVVLTMLHEGGRWAAELDQPGVAGAPRTQLELALTEASDDAQHLLGLLREHLGRQPLPAPTLDLRLHCDDRVHRPPPSGELFPGAAHQAEGFKRLIERLQARLGPQGVQRPVLRDDHRPEQANALVPLTLCGGPDHSPSPPPLPASAVRPVWLLHPPQPLQEGPQGPGLGSRPLQLLSGPERLETGWWDDGLVERDYFIAQADDGCLLWIYRHRRPAPVAAAAVGEAPGAGADWFLHGRFG